MTHLNRRHFIAAAAATFASGCASRAQSPAASAVDRYRTVPNPAFRQWIAAFRPRALAKGISAGAFDRAFASAGYIPEVVNRDRNQIQTRRSLDEYLSIMTSDARVSEGRAAFRQFGTTLQAIESRYGVEAKIVAAIWGVESRYGTRRGTVPVVSSAATLAFDGRRGSFFESQLVAALRILERGDTTPDQLVGSWAGAMGHTQFIPTSYESFAVDFTGDGRRDVWSDDPTDALASTAAYLSRNGWRAGLPWGAEAGPGAPAGRTIQPQSGGVQFTVTRNFNVLKTYNNSDFYALGVGLLADRIAGGGPLRGTFPPDANGLTRADRIALQQGLTAQGYDVGTIDGVIGSQTEAAIGNFQARRGLPVTNIPSPGLLDLLK